MIKERRASPTLLASRLESVDTDQSPLLSSPGGTVGLAWTLLGVNTTYSLFINVCGWPTRACLYGCGYVCVCGGGGEC